jgi:hypothetical protein
MDSWIAYILQHKQMNQASNAAEDPKRVYGLRLENILL